MILDFFPSLKTLKMILDTVTEVSIVVFLTKTSCTELYRGESHEDPHPQRTEHHKSCRHHRILFQSVGSGILHLTFGEEVFGKWEHLEHLEIAVTSNRSVWHSCYEKGVSHGHTWMKIAC